MKMQKNIINYLLMMIFFILLVDMPNSFAVIVTSQSYNPMAFLKEIDEEDTTSFLLKCLNDDDKKIRSLAAIELGALHVKDAIPTLLDLLKDDDSEIRRLAVQALGELQAKNAIPALLDLLKDKEGVVRSSVASVLSSLQAKDAIPILVSLLKDENSDVRASAAEALAMLQAKDAISPLIGLLKDEDSVVRTEVARALATLQAKDAIPALIGLLKDKNGDADRSKAILVLRRPRASAAEALAILQAKDAIPTLLELLKDKDSSTRTSAVNALATLKVKDAIPMLLELIKDKSEDSYIRASVAKALATLQAKDAIPTLLELLKDKDSSTRASAADALVTLQAKDAIPALLELLKDKDNQVRSSVAIALGTSRAKEAIPALLELLKDERSNVRYSAGQALIQLGKHSMMPNLFAAISDDKDYSNYRRLSLESSSPVASGELLSFLLHRLKNGNSNSNFNIRQSAAIAALHMERGNNLNAVQKRLLRKSISLVDQKTRDAAAEQLADEDKKEAEEKARQLPVNQPGLEAKPLTLDELKTKLDEFDQAYADWRERRDAEPAANTANDAPATDNETDKLADPAPFIYEYAYAIANMDEAEGIKLLGHNLAKVREAAARGLANSDFLGIPLLQKLEQEWLATDNPITRQGLFHAIDIALLAMEGIGADKELEALKAYEPTLTNERSAASIKPRVEWTRIQLQWRVDALKELKELADRQLRGLLKEYCLNPDGTDMKPEKCTIER